MLEFFFRKEDNQQDKEKAMLSFLEKLLEGLKREGYNIQTCKIIPAANGYEVKCLDANGNGYFTSISIHPLDNGKYRIASFFADREFVRVKSACYDALILQGGTLLEERKQELILELSGKKRPGRHAEITANDYLTKIIKKEEKKEDSHDTVMLADIGGLGEIKKELCYVLWGLQHPKELRLEGGRLPRGILLYGPPGCGKTYLARAIACEAKAYFRVLNAGDMWSKWHMDAPNKLKDFFADFKAKGSGILYIDEIDVLAGPRTSGTHAADKDENRMVSILLTEMDGMASEDNMILMGSTNLHDPDKNMSGIDQALLRPGRFDKIIHVPLPDKDARREILSIHIMKKQSMTHKALFQDIDAEALAVQSEGKSGADIEHLLSLALQKRIEAKIASGKEQPPLTQKDMLDTLMHRPERKVKKIGF